MVEIVKREGFIDDEAVQTGEVVPLPSGDVWPMRIKLKYKPVVDPSKPEPIRELVFRQPSGGDINYVGNPVKMGEGGIFSFDERKMHMMMGRLSGILTPLLDQMDSRDWNTCAYRLLRFFLPSWD
jgi:hypothetical protein